MKALLKTLLRLVITAVVVYGIACAVYYASQDLLSFPGKGLYTGNTPEWRSRLMAVAGQGFAPVEIPSKDGKVINALWAPCPTGPAPAILWFHSRDQNITEINQHLKPLQRMGVCVLAMEFRGYGNSPGDTNEKNLLEDAEVCAEYLRGKEDVAGRKVYAGGLELGANLALKLSIRTQVSAVFAVSPLPSLATAVERNVPFLPVGLLIRDRFDLVPALSSVICPVLLAHGSADSLVSAEQIDAMRAAIPGQVRVMEIPGAGSEDVVEKGGKEFMEEVDAFLSKTR